MAMRWFGVWSVDKSVQSSRLLCAALLVVMAAEADSSNSRAVGETARLLVAVFVSEIRVALAKFGDVIG